ncbi:MAG: hypothetical protein ACOCVY_00715 [Patescibacteria group bacterium]
MQKDNDQKKHQDPEEKEKKFLLWSGIVFFMVLITSLWSFNFYKVFVGINKSNPGLADSLESGAEVGDTMEEISGHFQVLKELKNININTTTKERSEEKTEEEVLLRGMAEELEDN